ncbi:Hypothetical predicted protein [Podarcis lilfordi]|uniref:Uncharacterized protein n=1 Tax=Podarcis lilfordi TaxID=74358 RepID=A0AA35PCW9_9SAUR|nr:Hypothetical predicted protein [Podarcis lilfordi]
MGEPRGPALREAEQAAAPPALRASCGRFSSRRGRIKGGWILPAPERALLPPSEPEAEHRPKGGDTTFGLLFPSPSRLT